MSLAGKTALITGSSSGIGRAIALTFSREGADIVINGRDENKIARGVSEVEASGGKAIGLRADVSRFGDVNAMVEQARTAFGRIDILVNNAGIASAGSTTNLCGVILKLGPMEGTAPLRPRLH